MFTKSFFFARYQQACRERRAWRKYHTCLVNVSRRRPHRCGAPPRKGSAPGPRRPNRRGERLVAREWTGRRCLCVTGVHQWCAHASGRGRHHGAGDDDAGRPGDQPAARWPSSGGAPARRELALAVCRETVAPEETPHVTGYRFGGRAPHPRRRHKPAMVRPAARGQDALPSVCGEEMTGGDRP